MALESFRYIGKGVYSLAEAARLSKVSPKTISRWTQGYTYRYKDQERFLPPIVARALGQTFNEGPALTFSDLLEVRFLEVFRKYGVSSKAIRIAAINAQEFLGRPHPFSTQFFKTDGHTILAEIVRGTGDRHLLDLVKKQYVFKEIMAPYLYEGIEFNPASKEPDRWWPLGRKRTVVIDPLRSFGAPIVNRGGVPTKILANAYKAEQSIPFVAAWYAVATREVHDAIEFEKQFAA